MDLIIDIKFIHKHEKKLMVFVRDRMLKLCHQNVKN